MPRVLLLEGPESRALLEERARKGLDGRDELWGEHEQVIHVVPAPHTRHQLIEIALVEHLLPRARAAGLTLLTNTGVHRPGAEEFRIPDIVVFDIAHASERGLEGNAAAVLEIVSPRDESWDKVPYYLDVGCGEIVLIDRDTLEVAVVREVDADDGPIVPDDTTITALGVTLTRVADDHLHLTWDQGGADVEV